jgi:DNA repair photolyase
MAYYLTDQASERPVLGDRRPTINEFFLSSYTMHTYAGCEFGCPYCDGWAFSQRALNETVQVSLDLPQRLAAELEHVDRGDLIALSSLSDPYQPAEQTYRITRQVLQLFADRGQPCLILTKSPSVVEDIPLLRKINEQSLAVVMCTIVTADPYLSAQIEGRAPHPALRLEALAELKRAGIPVGAAIVPIMPYVNDTDHAVRSLLRALAAVPVDFVVWDYLHIPNERHRARINEMLARVGSYPASYYRDIYRGQTLPTALYRSERSAEIADRCDGLGIEVRAPHKLYAGKLRPQNEAALLLKQAAFRDEVARRLSMAALHRELAALAYQGNFDAARFRVSPLWPTLQEVLQIGR